MSKLHISDEGVAALWSRLARELEAIPTPHGIPKAFLEMTARDFQDEGFDGDHDIFEVVCSPTGRAGECILSLRISRAINRYLAVATKNALGVVCHG